MNMASLGNIIKEGKEGVRGEGVDCQVLEDEEFELVCHVTDLATLELELSEVRRHVAVQRNAGVYQPYKVFGRGSTSVQISDIARGLWCEQQVEYGHLYPYLRRTEGWRRVQAEKRTVIQQRTPVMKAGSHIHYKKEIEIHDVPIQVVAPTREDKWAVDLINTYIKLAQISRGGIGAEIKIYCAFEDTVLAGIIDQLQYCKEDHSLILMEHKTRKSNTLPQEEQKRGHYLQLMLYKFILDSFTSGTTNYCNVAKALGLKLSQILGPGPIEHAYNTGLLHNDLLLSPNGASMGDICSQSNKPQTSFSHNSSFSSDPTKTNRVSLEELINIITVHTTDLRLPSVDALLLQYIYQEDDQVLGIEPVLYDEEWAMKELRTSLSYWIGRREARGVDIEESYKCGSCQYAPACVWRKKQLVSSSPVKKWPPLFIQDTD